MSELTRQARGAAAETATAIPAAETSGHASSLRMAVSLAYSCTAGKIMTSQKRLQNAATAQTITVSRANTVAVMATTRRVVRFLMRRSQPRLRILMIPSQHIVFKRRRSQSSCRGFITLPACRGARLDTNRYCHIL